jgi:hypothetical protein
MTEGVKVAKPPKLPKPPKDKSKEQVVDAIKMAVEARAGQPVAMIYPNFNPKGFDTSFKGGGQFKLRPKPDVVLAKLYGLPKPADRWLGVGKSIPEALANMKLEAPGAPEEPEAPAPAVAPSPPVAPSSPPVLPPKPKKVKSQLPSPAKTPGPEREVIGGQALHNDAGVDQETFDRYANALQDATEMYQRRGFGFMLGNFTMHLRKGKPGILGNYTGAEHKTVNPEVEMFVNNLDKGNHDDIALTMIHEIAHHYYYKEIPRGLRKTFDWYYEKTFGSGGSLKRDWVISFVDENGQDRVVQLKRQSFSSEAKAVAAAREVEGLGPEWKVAKATPPASSSAISKQQAAATAAGSFASDYGASSRYEDFPEVIASFVGRAVKRDPKIMKYQPLTQEQIQRLRSFLSQDKRINLKAESEVESLFGRVVLGGSA